VAGKSLVSGLERVKTNARGSGKKNRLKVFWKRAKVRVSGKRSGLKVVRFVKGEMRLWEAVVKARNSLV
jgi:hypothetical protein